MKKKSEEFTRLKEPALQIESWVYSFFIPSLQLFH